MTAAELLSIGRLRTRDHDAFGALVDRHYLAVRRYLARLLGDSEVAAELTQETFLRAYQALPRLADDSDVAGWLFRIATNLARQHHRHRQLIGWSPLAAHHARRAPGGSLEDGVVRQDVIRQALERLSLDQRACLLLYAWAGYTCAEIGEMIGRSTGAVRMLLVRARRRFRAAYGDGFDLEGGHRAEDAGDAGAGAGGGGTVPRSGRRGGGHAGRTGRAAGAGGVADVESLVDPGSLGSPKTVDDLGNTAGRGRLSGDCRAVEEVLFFYPRGDLTRSAFSAVTRHLAGCARCRQALLDVQATLRLLQRHLHLAGGDEERAAAGARVRAAARALAAVLPDRSEVPAAPGTLGPPAFVPGQVPVAVPARRRLPWEPETF